MKLISTLFLSCFLCGYSAKAQTISLPDADNPKKATLIEDVDIKNKSHTITPRPQVLTIRVNSSKEFKGKAFDVENKNIPLDASPGFKKSGTAVISFIPNSATVIGTSIRGTSTDGSQLLKVDIDVSSKGYYTAVTNIINGVHYYATGYLDEGRQVLPLKAIGTPIAAGDFKYTINAGGVNSDATVKVVAGTAVTSATVAIEKNGTGCSLFKLDGKMQVGKELQTENKITLKINASSVGYFTISTEPVNGYFFSAALIIKTIGSQDIELTGKGTPLLESTADEISITDKITKCNKILAEVTAAPRDFTDYVLQEQMVKVEFTNPDTSDIYTLLVPENKQGEDDENEDILLGGASAYEEAIFNTYGKENLIMTPYGLMINTRIDNRSYIYGGPNYVHIFLDEMGNSLITGIPQGMPEVQYVVHVVYVEKSDVGKKISYGIKTTKASFTGISRIENNRGNATGELNGREDERITLREYTLVIRTADSDIDFEVYRFENGKQTKTRLTYTIPMTKSYTANISLGLLNTWLKNPDYSLTPDPADATLNVVKQTEGNNRGVVTVFATLYTSPITILKYYINRGQIKNNRKKLSDISNPVTNAQLHSKNYLYMRPVWERIYPTIGVGVSDKVFQNLFFGLNWEFARGGSFFAGGHYGRVNIFNAPPNFEFEKTNLTQAEFDLYTNKDWRVGWAVGASIDFAIIGNLFK
jgi:hypothetical protein